MTCQSVKAACSAMYNMRIYCIVKLDAVGSLCTWLCDLDGNKQEQVLHVLSGYLLESSVKYIATQGASVVWSITSWLQA